MTIATHNPLVLPASEYFRIYRHWNSQGFLVEIGFIVSYNAVLAPTFRVTNWKDDDGTETDAFDTEDAQEALNLYNGIVQGDGS